MQFTNIAFLFGFLPLACLFYRLCKTKKSQNLFLVIASMIFYAFGSLRSLMVLIAVLLWNYAGCRQLSLFNEEISTGEITLDDGMYIEIKEKKKRTLIITIVIDLLILFMYRYFTGLLGTFSFLIGPVNTGEIFLMPIGLSFYLFSCMSALFDLYRSEESCCSLVEFALFAAFFGWVNMGPIAHYNKLKDQLNNHPLSREKLRFGAILFLQGICFKVVFADNLGLIFSGLSGNTTWLGNLLLNFSYFFMIYFDFAGYSRMARGIGSIFGFGIPRNFDHPYLALSVQDFWRRWHISLTSWFRDYVYIPLGGNRVDQKRWILNVLAVWLLTGIWHGFGLSFIFWGLLQGGLILFERLVLKEKIDQWPEYTRRIWVIFWELCGWTLFSSTSLMMGLSRIIRMSGIGASGFCDSAALFYLKNGALLLIFCILVISRFGIRFGRLFRDKVLKARHLESYWIPIRNTAYIGVFIVCLVFLIAQSAQTFLYAAF